eukprot:jgi/Hompol1/3976/HPOL_006860-RA
MDGILHQSSLPQLSYISSALAPLTRIDFITALPTEISFQILRYLDGKSLCHSAQVSRRWRSVADDDAIWHRMCTQHIDKKCAKCGWGLPLMRPSASTAVKRINTSCTAAPATNEASKRQRIDAPAPDAASSTEQTVIADAALSISDSMSSASSEGSGTAPAVVSTSATPSASTVAVAPTAAPTTTTTRKYRRPWKEVYAERLIVERNWRNAKYTVRELGKPPSQEQRQEQNPEEGQQQGQGHTDGVMALWYDECLGKVVTGGYDHTLRLWDANSGSLIATMTGHTRCVRGAQFDESKLISCSMDRTLRIWSMRDFRCVRVIANHNDGVVCLHFVGRILASGSVDGVVRVNNFETNRSSSLNGHTDWVNAVRILPCGERVLSCSDDMTMR